MKFHERFAEGAAVAEVAAGNDEPSGTCQSSCWRVSMAMAFWPSMRNGLMEFSR